MQSNQLSIRKMQLTPTNPTWLEIVKAMISAITLAFAGYFIGQWNNWRAAVTKREVEKKQAGFELRTSVDNLSRGFSDLSAELKSMNNHLIDTIHKTKVELSEKIDKVDEKVEKYQDFNKQAFSEVHKRLQIIEKPKV